LKIAYTGSHGTGKTTSMFEYAHKCKLEFPNKKVEVFHENAAKAPKGLFNKSGTEQSQLWIFTNQIRSEIELYSTYDILICDRTCFDSIAYTKYLGFDKLADKMFDLALEHLETYYMIYFKLIKNNDFLHNCEHRDVIDLGYRKTIETYLISLYEKAGVIESETFCFI